MITKLTHVNVWVINQDSAYDFYTNKLGFKVKLDLPMGQDGRWLTVTPPGQPDLELVLFPVSRSVFSGETIDSLKHLVQSGTFGVAVLTCDDIFATYEELSAKGVEFSKPPTKEFYGTEAIFKDDSGNWYSLAQLT
ncbi:VOC family protein [Puia dinghuensis]|uniref:Glyoxalase n=1 Tax=Puia dinghuensis TaxID=1792502 RepID=A0A8J2UIC7_9BACT|nr:VOC family protein [Puia dinghuensis]GGB20426.1 glyoxalase [Puia dinghuensis]